jgi:SAM-dependent MidA family methyltransferase
VRTYIGGQQGGDPLQAPGTQDMTADVDFGALSAAASAVGVEVEQLVTQPAWLRSHGWDLPTADVRTEEDWALAGLLDERLPFMVWLARR